MRGATADDLAVAARHIGMVISDRYRLVELIATGGMGAVYKAEHLLLRKWVAVKLLHPQTKNLPEQVVRFEREAIAGAHLQHPNIASATDFGKLPDGSYFLVLEYVRGVPLEDVIKREPLPARRTLEIARQIAAALAAAHKRGIIHRDMKPHNVMIDPAEGDQIKLIDFGLAKVPLDRLETTDQESTRGGHRAITQRDMVFGTVAYMAPEAAGGMDKVDERSDLYALGIMLYEMLTGKHPFVAASSVELFRHQCNTPPPPMKQRAPGVDVAPELEALVMRLLHKQPAQRFESARDLLDAFDEVMPAANPRMGSSPSLLEGGGGEAAAGAARGSGPDADAPAAAPKPAAAPPPKPAAAPPLKPAAPPVGAPPAIGQPLVPTTSRQFGSSVFVLLETQKKRRRTWAIGAGVALVAVAIGAALFLGSSSTPDAGGSPAEGASAASPPSSAPGPVISAATPGKDRESLLNTVKYKEWSSAEEALVRLLRSDPAAFREREVKSAAAAIAVKVASRTDARAEQVLAALEKNLGADGLDVLYEMVSAQGDSKGAERALQILRRPEVLGRLSPPLRIAVELRGAPCAKKPGLFKRAAKEGDERALAALEQLRSPQCKSQPGQCCYRTDPALEQAMKSLRARQGLRP